MAIEASAPLTLSPALIGVGWKLDRAGDVRLRCDKDACAAPTLVNDAGLMIGGLLDSGARKGDVRLLLLSLMPDCDVAAGPADGNPGSVTAMEPSRKEVRLFSFTDP